MNESLPLARRVALVTGSGRGLGRGIAERLVRLGAAVAVHDISQQAPAEYGEADSLSQVAEELVEGGGKAAAFTADLTLVDQVEAMVGRIERELGGIDILVNCAGGDIAAKGGRPSPNDALGVSIDDVRAVLDRNLIATMLLSRTVCPNMVKRGRGAVVNLASLAAHQAVEQGVAYAVAKAAVVQFTRCLALEMRPHGVRVNAVSPGPTMTARFVATRETDPAQRDLSAPLQRYGQCEEVADCVVFLVGDESRFVSGQVLCVDGGRCLTPS